MTAAASSTLPAPIVTTTSPSRASAGDHPVPRPRARAPSRSTSPAAGERVHLRRACLSRPAQAPLAPRRSPSGRRHPPDSKRRQLLGEIPRPRVEVRLEEHEDTSRGMQLPNRGERRLDLRRVMGVIVVHRHPAGRPAQLEPPACAPESARERPPPRPARLPRARARPAPPQRFAGCGRPRPRARTRPARARLPSQPSRTRSSHRVKSSSTSPREANVE